MMEEGNKQGNGALQRKSSERLSFLERGMNKQGSSSPPSHHRDGASEDGKQPVTFMQFCSMITNFTRTSSQMLEVIYQAVQQFHKTDSSDVTAKKEREQELTIMIRELRDSTAAVLIVLKNNFNNITSLPPSQQLVLNFSTTLIRLLISFSNAAKKLESSEELGRLYKEVLSSAKQTVSSINFSLKGSFVSEEQINNLVKNVKDVKTAATELEGKVRTRDKANYFTAARAFVAAVNDLMATSSEMGILEVNLEAKLKASVVNIMSAGKTALGSTWDSVTAIVTMHEGKEELYLILKDLLTKCSMSRKAAAMEMEKLGDIHMSLPARTLSPMARTATMMKSVSASLPGTPNHSALDIQRSFNAKAKSPLGPPDHSAPSMPKSSPPPIERAATTPHVGIPSSMLNLFATHDVSPTNTPEAQADVRQPLRSDSTPNTRNSGKGDTVTPETFGRQTAGRVLERTVSSIQPGQTDRKSGTLLAQGDVVTLQGDETVSRPRSLSFGSGSARRLNSTQTIMPPAEHDELRRTESTTSSILLSSEEETQRGNSVHSDVSRGSRDVFTDVDLRGSWEIRQAELNVAKKSKPKLASRKEKESKESKESRETKDPKGSKGKSDSKQSQKPTREVIDADVPLEEIVQRVTNAFVDQYSHFREEYHSQTETEKARSMTLVATSLQNKFPEISNNIPPPPPPPKKTWKKKLIPSCFRPTRMKSVQLPPDKLGWS